MADRDAEIEKRVDETIALQEAMFEALMKFGMSNGVSGARQLGMLAILVGSMIVGTLGEESPEYDEALTKLVNVGLKKGRMMHAAMEAQGWPSW